MERTHARHPGITALALFFAAGALISGVSGVALLSPGGVLEPMWRLNPRARENFAAMGVCAPVLMAVVCVTCALAAVGLWRRRVWGYRVAVALLACNLAGDVVNAVLGIERRAVVGIPIVLALLVWLTRPRVRAAFGPPRVT